MNKSNRQDPTWFSQYYGIDKQQFDLPFLDFDLNADVPLYIDPYSITKDGSDLGARCHNLIIHYFQTLIDAINSGNLYQIKRLIHGRLAEPSEIHLGVSQTARGGRGIGNIQEDQIVDALANSRAAKAGIIQAIQELELHIDGIGPDKISDLVGNIILGELAIYTESICSEHLVPTKPIAVSGFWNSDRKEWDSGYFNIPYRNSHSYILVPKQFARRSKDLMNHREFFDKYALSVIQRELLDANDSLVQTLKNGARRVTKESIREDERFPYTKEFISEFIRTHLSTLQRYKQELETRFLPIDPAWESQKCELDDPIILATLDTLPHIKVGKEGATEYHEAIFTLLRFIFDWCLEGFEKEFKMDGGRSRIDIIANNVAQGGLFQLLIERFQAFTIPMECKNYSAELGNNEFNQIMERLGPKTSQFGMIFCRQVSEIEPTIKHLTDRFLRHNCMILIFDDNLVRQLVGFRIARDYKGLEYLLWNLIRSIEYGNGNEYFKLDVAGVS